MQAALTRDLAYFLEEEMKRTTLRNEGKKKLFSKAAECHIKRDKSPGVPTAA